MIYSLHGLIRCHSFVFHTQFLSRFTHATYSLALCSQLCWVCLTVLVNECRVFGMLQRGGPSGHCRRALEVLWEKPLRSAMATGGLQHSTSSPCADLRKGNLGWRNRGVAPELFPEHSVYPVPPTRFHMTEKSLSVCVCVCRVICTSAG